MSDRERRNQVDRESAASLRAGLNHEQLAVLQLLEQFGWTLRFVRRPLFLTPVPVVFAPDGKRFSVLEEDGTVNDNPGFTIRS